MYMGEHLDSSAYLISRIQYVKFIQMMLQNLKHISSQNIHFQLLDTRILF